MPDGFDEEHPVLLDDAPVSHGTRVAPGVDMNLMRWGALSRTRWQRYAIATLCSVVVAGGFGWRNASLLHAQDSCSDTAVCAVGVFCSQFEEGNKNIWDDYDGNPDSTNLLMTDTGPCNKAGNRVMRLRVPAGRGTADLVKVLPSSHDKLYTRWYAKWEPGYDFTAENHGGGLHAGNREWLSHSGTRPTGADWYTAWFEPLVRSGNLNARGHLYTYYRGMYQDCANPTGGNCWGDRLPCILDEGTGYCTKPQHRETVMPPQLQTGRWYCIETMLDGGTPTTTGTNANGAENFWVDNVQYGPWTDLWMRTTSSLKINILWLALFHHADHSVQGIMLDDVVVSTSRVGCHGTSTGVAPAAPTSLRIS